MQVNNIIFFYVNIDNIDLKLSACIFFYELT